MKKIILKSALCALLLGLTTQGSAQTNPKKGYIITNQDDTIHGTIDYLTTMKCVEACLFQKDGETTYKKYLPTEIKGYRADDDAMFYESHTLPFEDNETRVLFAEYLVLGEISLLHVPTSNKEYYYLIDKDGKLAQLKDYDDFDITTAKMKTIVRQNIANMAPMFEKHPLTLDEFKMDSFNNRDLTRIIKKYDTTYCRDWGDCIQFEQHNEQKENYKGNFKVGLGVTAFNNHLKSEDGYSKMDFKTVQPGIYAGYNLELLRVSKYLMLQTDLSLSPASKKFESNQKLSFIDTEFKFGAAYRLFNRDHKGFNPYLRAGASIDYWLGYHLKANKYSIFNQYDMTSNTPASQTIAFGYYAGIGCLIPIGQHTFELNADYKYLDHKSIIVKSKGFCITAFYIF